MYSTTEQFISEPLKPIAGSLDTSGMARGEPGLPGEFIWRKKRYRVVHVLEKSKSSGPCRNGANEMYLRRHWYKIETSPKQVMTVYCERQPRSGKQAKQRWFVYSVETI